jgi:N-acetylmuramoyl-L-alanine amidase
LRNTGDIFMSIKCYVGAGHSNIDPGAVSSSGLQEAKLMAKLRNLVAKHITASGDEVVTDGTDEVNLPLGKSIELAKNCDPGRRVELHLNSGPAQAKGVECLSLPEQKQRAQAIAKAIADTIQIPLRGDEGWKSDTEGQHPRLGFCRQGGGIVVECFFLSNYNELATYQGKENEVAKAIATVLLS